MKKNKLNKDLLHKIIEAQKNEATENIVYKKLAKSLKDTKNKRVLENISKSEQRHYQFWKNITQKEVKPDRWKIFKFFWIARLFGITFGIKLMENGEKKAQVLYNKFKEIIPEISKLISDEHKHENKLVNLIKEERLQYLGSVVLGLNDALVELTGTLAGLTFAIRNARVIALAGIITGIAAALSMAASQYLSTKSEGHENPLKASIYTGVTYIITVILLVLPYLLINNYILCLVITMSIAIFEIFLFNYYISVAKDLSFKKRFLEMAIISLLVAALSFVLGYLIKILLNVDL